MRVLSIEATDLTDRSLSQVIPTILTHKEQYHRLTAVTEIL